MRSILTVILAVLLGGTVMASDLHQTVRKVKPSIVAVGTHMALRRQQDVLRGTGFVVGNGKHVVTNSHVVPRTLDQGRREQVAIYLAGRSGRPEMRKAQVVKRDVIHDLCLLRFDGPRIRPLRLGRASEVREGELIAFTGFPILEVLGLYPATHEGIVSAIAPIALVPDLELAPDKRSLHKIMRPFRAFWLDATAYPGNSGSPVYDAESGQVVGVINSVRRGPENASPIASPSGISFAVPVRFVRNLLEMAGLRP
jgi:S1-C subfamily serine protease